MIRKKQIEKRNHSAFNRIIGTLLLSLTISTGVMAYPSGSPAGYTGSPGDAHHCQSCHGGSTATVPGWITSNIPATGYVAGTVYTITATVTGTGKKGFEVSPQNITGTQLGVLAAGTGSKLVGGTKYVTQSSAGSTTGTKTWNFTWTAPATGAGTVTFYGAFTVGEPNTKLSTLVVNESTLVPLTATASAVPNLICAGQSAQLNVVPSGGSGNYTYSWTSIPAGFTSSIQNPVVSPNVSTQYTAIVYDGANSVNSQTNVTVNQPTTANAGNDTTYTPVTTQVPLNGVASGYSGILWSTSGSGTFSAAGSLTGFYFPGGADITTGNVTLTLTASAIAPCSVAATDMRTIHFDWPTGIVDVPHGPIGLIISPNPSYGLFTMQVNGLDSKTVEITILDITGRTVVQQNLNTADLQATKFNITGTTKGLYLVKIQSGNEFVIRKLFIE